MVDNHPLSSPQLTSQALPARGDTLPLQGYTESEADEQDDLFDPLSIDPELRLRTVRTAHSVLAESIRTEANAEKRKRRRTIFQSLRRKRSSQTSGGRLTESLRKRSSASVPLPEDTVPPSTPTSPTAAQPQPQSNPKRSLLDRLLGTNQVRNLERRTLYINLPLPSELVVPSGDPIVRYVRNKVRTSKYTILTFIPKNLFEQFRRVANVYFLALVILPLFSIFGAPNAQIGMLPLLFILCMTAIKDGIEDWRRAMLDNEVNNSATTKLGGWRNVNQPRDPRTFFEKLFRLGPAPDRPSKGVRKLRQKEASAGKQIVMESQKDMEEEEEEEVLVIDKQAQPMDSIPTFSVSEAQDVTFRALKASTPSMTSRRSAGVLDYATPAGGSAQWERTLWKKLEAGDLVLLRDNEQVPADIIVLATSTADKLCFVETKNLDGETNLKVRRALKATSSISSEEDLEHARFVIDSEAPNANLYNYNGVLRYWPADKGEEKQEAITINELLLRGCTLRNTKWIIGVVVFTGADTKIMLNGGDTPSKRSKIEKETNFNVAMNFAILVLLCLLTAILHGYMRSLSNTSSDFYEVDSEASNNIYVDSVIIFFSCLIVFQNIVPISLYITIEIVKTIQAYFIYQDVEMYYEAYDTPCVPKSWNISDDLGQIEYVFSDKTGTLTQNIMEFKKCSIQGVTFGEGLTEAMMGAAKRDGRDVSEAMDDQEVQLVAAKERMVKAMKGTMNNRYLREDKLTLIAPQLPARMANVDDPLRPYIINFFRALAICHSVLSDTPDPKQPFVLDYKAESPDEAALVAAARDVGFPFVNRMPNSVDIEVLGRPERWVPLRVLEFNSSRKRMSVIARDPSGRIVLFCKGADSVIYERLSKNHDKELKESTLRDLETFSNGGLRTLCIAYRYLDEGEYTDWAKKFDAASAAITDREAEIDRASELIEHSLEIIGATALEDKLQEGVPEAIATLHRAGIKLWILTGDKLQTAIEIGYSCNLLTNDMEVMIISADSEEGARAQIEAGLNKIASMLGPPDLNTGTTTGKATFAVVIDGESLRYALLSSLKGLFLSLGMQCSAVICCRVSPSQKALTVRLVKEGCKAMTLSIGDGANDVAMIQEANVGVGLFGLEGSQAAMSADYAFGQFRFLTRLLLVHGRWSYVRIADMHANFFYKNIVWTIALFWYLPFSSFDATYLFEYTFLLLFNLVFTSLPVGILGAFDQDTNAKASLAFPQLYKRGIGGLEYSRRRFWIYMFDGLYQSAVIFFIPMLAYGTAAPWSSTGRGTESLYELGTTVACSGVLTANLYVGVNTRYFTVIQLVTYIGSTLLIWIWIPIYSALASLPFNGEVAILYTNFSFWAIVLITTFIAVGPRWLIKAVRQSYFPTDKDLVREAWVAGALKDELGISHRNRQKRRLPPESAPEPPLILDERGEYEVAATSSPRKDYSRSPVISGPSSPRSPMSYPPPSPLFQQFRPSEAMQFTVPPPLSRQGSTATSTEPPDRLAGDTTGPHSPLSAEYVSPSAVEAFNLAQREIRRLSRDSVEIRRASVDLGGLGGDSAQGRGSIASRRRSLLVGGRERLPAVRSSVDFGTQHEREYEHEHELDEGFGASGERREGGRGGEQVASGDFSESGEWEEEASRRRSSRRRSMADGTTGYAV